MSTTKQIVIPTKGPTKETIVKAIIRKATILLFVMMAFSSFSQKLVKPNIADYIIPQEDRTYILDWPDTVTLDRLLTDGSLLSFARFIPREGIFSCHSETFCIVYTTSNYARQSSNDITGVQHICMWTEVANDCSNKPYTEKLDVYVRAYSHSYYIEYESLCEGVKVATGNSYLKTALKYTPTYTKRPPVKAARN